MGVSGGGSEKVKGASEGLVVIGPITDRRSEIEKKKIS
jgi:hypothetical protein